MQESPSQEIEKLCAAARDIVTYKRLLAAGFTRLADRTTEPRSAGLLAEIAAQEQQDIELWLKKLASLAGCVGGGRALDLRAPLMMAVLGPRGFLEWALIAEDDALHDLSIQVANLPDPAAAASWTRFANDEYLHVVRLKEDVLGMPSWEMGGGGGVRDVIFGANDGLVSILALVAGVFGAVTDSYLVLIAGVAGAVAGTVSMGAGAYVSSKSEQEVTQKEQQRRQRDKTYSTPGDVSGLAQLYVDRGFDQQTAVALAGRVTQRLQTDESLSLGAADGLAEDADWPPAKAGLLTGLSFFIASLIPILPFTFLDVYPAAVLAIVASILAMFLIGASKAIFTRQSVWRSGFEVMAIGVLASAATYIIGQLIPI